MRVQEFLGQAVTIALDEGAKEVCTKMDKGGIGYIELTFGTRWGVFYRAQEQLDAMTPERTFQLLRNWIASRKREEEDMNATK